MVIGSLIAIFFIFMFIIKVSMQVYLTQNSVNSFYISNVMHTDGYDYYLLSLKSVVTNEEYVCIPNILSTSDRVIYISFELDNTAISAPLIGILSIYLPGTYIMNIYVTDEDGTITPTNKELISSNYAILECSDVEVTQTVYNDTTPNPNVYFMP